MSAVIESEVRAPGLPSIESRLIAQVRALMAACEASHAQQKGKAAHLAHAFLALDSAAVALREAQDKRSDIVEKVAETLARDYEANRFARRVTQEKQLAIESELTAMLKSGPYSLDDLPELAELHDPHDTGLYEFCLQMVVDRDASEADYKNGEYL